MICTTRKVQARNLAAAARHARRAKTLWAYQLCTTGLSRGRSHHHIATRPPPPGGFLPSLQSSSPLLALNAPVAAVDEVLVHGVVVVADGARVDSQRRVGGGLGGGGGCEHSNGLGTLGPGCRRERTWQMSVSMATASNVSLRMGTCHPRPQGPIRHTKRCWGAQNAARMQAP